MSRRVGRITLAATLILLGVALVADNLTAYDFAWYIARLWPLMLIFLGLEWVWATSRQIPGEPIRTDGGAIVGLILLAIISSIWSNWSDRFFPAGRWILAEPNLVRHVVTPPPGAFFRGFGNVREEIVLTHSAPVEGMREVVVDAASASVEVVAGSSFRVDLTVTGYGVHREAALESARQTRLRVISGPTTTITADSLDGGDRRSLSYRVEVPEGVAVRVKTSSGSARVEGVRAAVAVETSSGSVSLKQIRGDVTTSATSGSVRLEKIDGAIRGVSSSGSIRIEESRGRVLAQSSSGSITVKLDAVTAPIDLTASSGSIHLELPDDADVTVEARSSSGGVSGPGWLTIGEGRSTGRGKNGNGAHLVQLRTSSGSIRVSD